jgi:PleD family two-component response regulator
MDEDKLSTYVSHLSQFVDNFSAWEAQTKAALEEKEYDVTSQKFTDLCDMLTEIYAYDMANECLNKIANFIDMNDETAEAHVTEFIAKVSALSIDIQMAVLEGEKADAQTVEDKTEEPEQEDETDEPEPVKEKGSILAVDDSPFFLNTLKIALQGTGYKLTCLTSGVTALGFLSTNVPSLFILDIDMTELSGFELAREIRRKGYKAPIIFLTGNAKKSSVMEAISAGGSDFIVKPLNKERVLKRIDKFFDADTPGQ